MWGWCGVSVASVESMWRSCGVLVASVWRQYSVHVASMWCLWAMWHPRGVHVASAWRPHDVYVASVASMWRTCGVHVASMWRSTRCGHCGGRLQYLNSQQLTWRVAMTTARRAAYLSWLYVTPPLGFQTRGRPSLASLLSDLQVDRLINVHTAESVRM